MFNYTLILHQENNESFCTFYNESESVCNDCESNQMNNNCCDPCDTSEIDCEKEAVRDGLMTTMGEVKLLYQQNHELLNKLNNSVIFTVNV